MVTHMRLLSNGCWDLEDARGEVLVAADSYSVVAAIQADLRDKSSFNQSEASEVADQIRFYHRVIDGGRI